MRGFEYPSEPHWRRHGPAGYRDYDSYRDWLRDEFIFRCVYCLHREQWWGPAAVFHIEHFVPVSVDPCAKCEYSNLLYACAACNEAKGDALDLPDPCRIAFSECLQVEENGQIKPLRREGQALVERLRLNRKSAVSERSRWIRTLRLLHKHDRVLYMEYMGFPEELPDLQRKRVPRNTKPEGATRCWFALRQRGELPEVY